MTDSIQTVYHSLDRRSWRDRRYARISVSEERRHGQRRKSKSHFTAQLFKEHLRQHQIDADVFTSKIDRIDRYFFGGTLFILACELGMLAGTQIKLPLFETQLTPGRMNIFVIMYPLGCLAVVAMRGEYCYRRREHEQMVLAYNARLVDYVSATPASIEKEMHSGLRAREEKSITFRWALRLSRYVSWIGGVLLGVGAYVGSIYYGVSLLADYFGEGAAKYETLYIGALFLAMVLSAAMVGVDLYVAWKMRENNAGDSA